MQYSNINPEALLRIKGDIWIFWKDMNGVYLGCNKRMANELGFDSPEDLIGKTDYDLNLLDVEADYFRTCDYSVLQQGVPWQFYDTPTLQNIKRLCLVIKIPLYEEDNRIIGILGLSYKIDKTLYLDQGSAPSKFNFFNNKIDAILLTEREKECLYFLVRGKYAREIAVILNISRRTVEQHLSSVRTKMKVTSKSELIEKVIDNYL